MRTAARPDAHARIAKPGTPRMIHRRLCMLIGPDDGHHSPRLMRMEAPLVRHGLTLPAPAFALLIALMLSGQGILPTARGQIDDQQFSRDLKAIAEAGGAESPSRSIGTPGYKATADYLRQQIGALPNVEYREQEYPVEVPITDRSDLTLSDGSVNRVYPFWPAAVRVDSTPAEGITGKLVYIGEGRLESIQPEQLHGQIAVMEASGRQAWQTAIYFGARAVIILGTPETTNIDLSSHELAIPVHFPRFYVPPGALSDRLRRLNGQQATLNVQVHWRRCKARNLIALVKASDPSTSASAMMFWVPFEASGLVPDLAQGASQAAQTAAGLALLRDAARTPLGRPVVVAFGGADSIQFLASRQLLLGLCNAPQEWRDVLTDGRDNLGARQERLQSDLDRGVALDGDPRNLVARKDRSLIERITKLLETDVALEMDQIFRLRMQPAESSSAADRALLETLQARQVRSNAVNFLLRQQAASLTDAPADGDPKGPGLLTVARDYLRSAMENMRTLQAQYAERHALLQQRIDVYRWLAGALHRPLDPDKHSNDSRLIELMVGLDLSDGQARCGPAYWGRFQQTSALSTIQDYRDWMSRQGAALIGRQQGVFDLEPLSGAQSPQSSLCATMAIPTEMAPIFGLPGFSLITLDDLRLRRDTPNDTVAALRVPTILRQLHAVRDVMFAAWNDPAFKGPVELRRMYENVRGMVLSASAGRPVADLPRPGFHAALFWATGDKVPREAHFPYLVGTRRFGLCQSDNDGRFAFEAIPKTSGDPHPAGFDMTRVVIEVFRFAGDGAIDSCTDLGKQADANRMYLDLKAEPWEIASEVFDCTEFSLLGLNDPRFGQDLTDVQVLDARRNAEPLRFNAFLHEGMTAMLLEPGQKSFLAFRYGRIGNRLLLANMLPAETQSAVKSAQDAVRLASRGFSAAELSALPPLAGVTANDFFNIDQVRLERYRAAGVQSQLVDDLHARARAGLAAINLPIDLPGMFHALAFGQVRDLEQALRGDGAAYTARINGAWANEARVYQATQEMANDVVRAAIFLLLLCIPFSFCMERLLIASPSVYRQIAGMGTIFTLMALMLWSFHPAFKISSSPLIIILAFAIITMSAVVIGVIYSRFMTELRRIRGGRGTAELASFARLSVLSSAALLGIANMRRRMFRTVLTSITVVLVTFAVLCFTSASRYLDVIEQPTGVPSSHPGLLIRQRGGRPLQPVTLQNLQAVLGDSAIAGKRQLVQRWWNINPSDNREVLHVVPTNATGRMFSARAALGLTPGESNLSAIRDVIGPAFDRLENGETHIIYLSQEIADQLAARVGDTVLLGGINLEIAGVFDASEFDHRVVMLSGEPIAPLKYAAGELDSGGRALNNNALESLDLDAEGTASEASNNLEHLSASEFVITSAAVSQMLPSASLHSVGVRFDQQEQVKSMAADLSKRFALAIFAGTDDGVKLVSSGSGFPKVSGAGGAAIPLIIAGLIIFNTMMGSIAERRREIHIYTSLGLAPLHVGVLFLAEAMAYGLIGAVFGYIGGQLAGFVLVKLGWLGGVMLNYSGTSAMLTMGLILLTVLLSALVPARIASKIAAPSIDRSWTVPKPDGDEITALLPFTINRTAADGALAYLLEFFETHKEGSLGKFSSAQVEPFTLSNDGQPPARGIKCIVWLTPFDLGVRQHLLLLIHPGQYQDIFEVQVVLQRLSGNSGSWYRMNRRFLTELRKQFLQWRSLSPQRMLEYVDASHKLF